MIRHAAGFVTLAFLLATQAGAEEGMWLPSQTPSLAPTLKQAGLTLDPAVLADLQKAPLNAIVSLGGCSASFVSPQGLVATNHHCVQGSIQYNSKPDQDYLTNGFLAGTLKDEVPAAPGTRVFVIEDLRDVSAAMNKGVTAAMSGLQRYDRMEANRKGLISACEKQPNRRCDVRAYYGGATYFLQQQLEIKDVRLVYAPAEGIGNFGGETDNWQWPRHTGDFGFYRAYVAPDGSSAPYSDANVPYQPKSWLKIAQQGVKDGDYVMVAGFPGVTDRLRSAAEADFYYDSYYPAMQKLLADYSAAIGRATAGNADATIKYASILQGTDNYKKKLLGQMAGADAVRLGEQKKAQEAEYRAWVAADPQRQKRYGASIAALDALIAEANEASLSDLRANLINRAQLLSASRTLYRWSLERAKPDAQREPGYQDRDRQLVTERLRQIERRFVPEVDRALFDAALAEYRKLPAARRNAAFEAKLAAIGADRLYAGTKLGDTATRLAWLDKPGAEFGASADPFLQLAVAMAPSELAKEKADKDRAGRLQRARSDYMKGMLAYAAATGKPMYPDANGSLRFTYGKVTGRTRDGQIWTPFTTAEGMAAKHTGKGEFDAPDKAVALVAAKDYGPYASPELGTLPVDFLSTVDITNGNSGSATLNAQGEFVGLAFDGTLDGVIADWWYEPSINRTIHVDSRYMLWVMDKVDGAQRLLDEMGVR
ncbi:S46 family peptidase [Sphingomonas sp. LY54]|uniref:S46 family peptidase n=1 Tax=Sphingomonas sp. LY54 TaxID=3095343 RepID=UPI002D784AC4|nr:S46 family peptidase [Sphingomonas sp. LY54]WRP29185.1 S46 family peptidase [Sphingomonas sp. LY54]